MFDDDSYIKLLSKAGVKGSATKKDIYGVLIALAIFWLPLAIITLINRTFWTGDITTSFITDFDVQARLLISMPVFILSDRLVRSRLATIMAQFTNAGIIGKEIEGEFQNIIQSKTRFLRSKWTDLGVLLVCYLQLVLVLYYESTNTSVLSWQIVESGGEISLNLAGKWFILLSGPFVLFFALRWLLRVIVWGAMLYKISRLKITLFPVHPDLCGGLGFLGYTLRFFSPVALAISATVAGNMADFMLQEGLRLVDLRFIGLAYFLFISLLFTLPLLFFIGQLINAREKSVFENDDYTNGIYRELRAQMSKGFEKVNKDDLKLVDFSAAADLSAVINNALNMKFIPFTLKDMIPLWTMTIIPFFGVVLIQIPVSEIVAQLFSILI